MPTLHKPCPDPEICDAIDDCIGRCAYETHPLPRPGWYPLLLRPCICPIPPYTAPINKIMNVVPALRAEDV